MMQEPKKPDADKPDPTRDLMKCVAKPDPEPAGRKAGRTLRNFFKKAQAVLTGDEAAKEEVADATAKAVVKVGDTIETAGKSVGDVIDKADRKIAEAQAKKTTTPKP
jgi:hypothetical protein